MKTPHPTIMFLVFLVLLIPGGTKAEEPKALHSLHFGTTLSQSFGDTHYELQAKAEDPAGGDGFVDIRSRLEFPLDATLLGIFVEWTPGRGPSRRWTVNARFDFNVTDPSEKMTDEDWIDSKQFSYTESSPELDMILAGADITYHLRPRKRTAVGLLIHFDYQRIEQYMVGFEGWRGTIFSDQQFSVSGTAPVLGYTVEYWSPQLGAVVSYRAARHFRVAAQVSAGVVYASDTDDHLLRGRISEGSGWGFGSGSRLEAQLEPGFLPLRWLSASLFGELRYFHAEGNVDQRWYRDEDLPAGTEINDIPYEIESSQGQIGASLGVSF